MLMVYYISKRFATEMYRLKISFLIMLAMPAFMGFMFFFAFSSSGLGEAYTYNIGVINEDSGVAADLADYIKILKTFTDEIPINDSTLDNGFAYDFINILNNTYYPDEENTSKLKIFHVTEIENYTIGKKMVESRNIDGLVIFNGNFS